MVLLARTLAFRPQKEALPEPAAIQVDQARLADSLQAMLRVPTISYPEKEKEDRAAFAQFKALLRTRYPLAFQHCSYEELGTNGILLHLSGKSAAQPSVLMAHYDVVPAEAGLWAHPPFEGRVVDGELWGRGALDTKCTLMGLMEALEALLAGGFVPENDLYLSFGGDEETLGQDTIAIVDHLQSKQISPAFVLDEGGAVVSRVFPGVSQSAALVGIAEKGSVFVDVTAKGKSGHASAPPAKQAVGQLARALLRIQQKPLPFTLTPAAAQLFDTLGRHSSFVYRLIFANLWCFAPLLNLICRQSGGELNALVRSTTALTRLEAAPVYNVLPNQARAGLNLRLISGDSIEQAVERLQTIIRDPGVQVTVRQGSQPSPVSPAQGEPWQRLKTAIQATYPEAIVSPYLMVAASDSRHYCRISQHVYRFSGLPLSREQLNLIHSHDERIPLKLLPDLVRFYTRVMQGC